MARKRISLTMKLDAQAPRGGSKPDNSFRPAGRNERQGGNRPAGRDAAPAAGGAMAAAFAKLKR